MERTWFLLIFRWGDGTGFALAQTIQRRWPGLPVIFLTGFVDFAVEGYEYQPLDFLVKPVRKERLERALTYAKKRLQQAPSGEITVGICTEDGFRMFRPGEVSYAEKAGRRVRICCRDSGSFDVMDSLGKLEEVLESHGFYRCH